MRSRLLVPAMLAALLLPGLAHAYATHTTIIVKNMVNAPLSVELQVQDGKTTQVDLPPMGQHEFSFDLTAWYGKATTYDNTLDMTDAQGNVLSFQIEIITFAGPLNQVEDAKVEISASQGGDTCKYNHMMTSDSVVNFPVVEQKKTITFFYQGCGD